MSQLDSLLDHPAEWLRAAGPNHEIVISSRIRLARNLSGYAFGQRLSEKNQEKLIQIVQEAVEKSAWMRDAQFYRYRDLDEIDRQFLLERHLISREHASEEGEKAVAVTPNSIPCSVSTITSVFFFKTKFSHSKV